MDFSETRRIAWKTIEEYLNAAPGLNAPADGSDVIVPMQAGVTNLGAAGGGVYTLPPGTYGISDTLNIPSNVVLRGAGRGATTINWLGGNNEAMVLADFGTTNAGVENLTLDAGSATTMIGLHLRDVVSNWASGITISSDINSSGTGLRLEGGNGDFGEGYNCAYHSFYNVKINKFNVGLQLDGDTDGVTPTVSTNNAFYNLHVDGSMVAIRFAQWCDTNHFFRTHIVLRDNNAICVLLNDSATPAVDTGVYNENFYDVSFDAFGGLAGCSGFFFNAAKQIQVYGFLHSPVTFPGTLLNDNSGRAISYRIVNNQVNGANNQIQVFSKGLYRASVLVRDSSGATYDAGPNDLLFDEEVTDATGTFTSPTFTAVNTRIHNVSLLLTHTAGVTAADQWLIKFVTTDREYTRVYRVPAAAINSVTFSQNVTLEVGDTLKVVIERLAGAGDFILLNNADTNILTIEEVDA